MLLLKNGSMWLVIFLLLGVRSSDSAEKPKTDEQKSATEEVQDSGGGDGGTTRSAELLQYQADSGGYKNNSEPSPSQLNMEGKDPDGSEVTVTSSITEMDTVATDKFDQVPVESSTHQEEMTFGEEFENSDDAKSSKEPELLEKPIDTAGSSVYEVIAEENNNRDDPVTGFPYDIGTEASNHEGYNEDAILYFESKRYKGLKKKTSSNSKTRENSNSITEPNNNGKERVHITSYVADIAEADRQNNLKEEKANSNYPPRDATTISTFFIAPKETVSRRTPVRIRKKIIKPVRLGYRKKQSPHYISDSPAVFRQKVPLVEPPSPRNRINDSKSETPKPEITTTENINTYTEGVYEHTDLPLEDKTYLPVSPVKVHSDDGPYVSPPQDIPLPIAQVVQRTPQQYLREEMIKFQNKENLSPVLPTALTPELPFEEQQISHEINPFLNSNPSISFINVLGQNVGDDYQHNDRPVHHITSKKQKELTNFRDEKLINDYNGPLANDYGNSASDVKTQPIKTSFEETNRAEDGLTSSDTILAPIQAAVSLSNHVQSEGKKRPVSNTIIEQQEIRVEPVMKTTIEIQKSIPFEIKETKNNFNHIPKFNTDYEKPLENVQRPPPYQNDFIQQVALAYHKLSNNGDYQANVQLPQITTQQPQHQPQNYVYFYRNRIPHQPFYLFPFYSKGVNDFNKGNVGPYIMQQSYKNLGYDNRQNYQGLKYQGLFPSLTRPLAYTNIYDLTAPIVYQPTIPVLNQNSYSLHQEQQQLRVPSPVEQVSNQHAVRNNYEEGNGVGNEEELEPPSTEEIDTTEEIKQGSEIQIQEAQQEIHQEHLTDRPPPLHLTQPQHIAHHVTEPPRVPPNNQPYPYGYSFIYPVSATDNRPQNPYNNFHRRGKAPPFRPSHPMYTSQYPPHTYIVATNIPDRSIHSRSINNKKLCIEYGGFKPPLVPSIQIDDEFDKEAQDKSSNDE